MELIKKHTTKEEMVNILESRGLIVDDEKILDLINYSHLIYRYGKHYFKNKEDKTIYKDGTKLSHIYNLYILNLDISAIIFKALFKIEHKLKSCIAHEISRLNSDPLDYLGQDFYSKTHESWEGEVEKFIQNMNITEENSRIKYKEEYCVRNKLPIWLLIDELTIGQLRMLMKLKNIDKFILSELDISIRKRYLLVTINEYRNRIYHSNPLVSKIIKKGFEYKLTSLLNYIKSNYFAEWKEILNHLKDLDFSKINMSQEALYLILGLEELEIEKTLIKIEQ